MKRFSPIISTGSKKSLSKKLNAIVSILNNYIVRFFLSGYTGYYLNAGA